MRADDDVDPAGGEIGEQLLAGVAGDLVGEQLDAQRTVTEEVVGVGHGEVGEERREPTAGAVRRAPRSAPSGRPGCPTRTAASSAVTATTVLPDPTSPWSRRCIGRGDDRSSSISPMTRCCAPVSSYGRAAWKRRTSSPPTSWTKPTEFASMRPLAADEDELHAQQLVERQPPAGLVLGVDRLREVDRSQRLAALDEVRRLRMSSGKRVGDAPRLGSDRGRSRPSRRAPTSTAGPSRSAGRSARSARCGRRSGRRSGWSSAARCGTASTVPNRATLSPSTSCRSRHGWLKNTTWRRPGAVADDRLDDRAAVARRPSVGRADRDQDERLGAGDEVGDACLVGAVDPAPRIGHQQVEDGLDAERLRARRACARRRRAARRRRDRRARAARSRSLDPEQVRVQRLAAGVDLQLDVGERSADPAAAARR